MRFRQLAAIDARSLALLRIWLALLVLIDIYNRSWSIPAFYVDDGMVPPDAVWKSFGGHWFGCVSESWAWSPHLVVGSVMGQALLFVFGAVAAVAFLVGYRTRWANFLVWAWLVSIDVRTTLLCNSGDLLLRMLIFWCLFLPTETVWSLDAKAGRIARRKEIISVGSFALLCQLFLMYFCTGLFKLTPDWLAGRAVQFSLALDWYRRPAAPLLEQFPRLLTGLTYGTLVLELIGPWFLWSPWKTNWIRGIVGASFLALHIGIELTIATGLFSQIAIASWSMFVPGPLWVWLHARFGWRVLAPVVETQASADESPSCCVRLRKTTGKVVCVTMLVIVVYYNVGTLVPFREVLPVVRQICGVTFVGQKWYMFDYPRLNDFWFVGRAHLRDGSTVDTLRAGQPVTNEKPRDLLHAFPDQHWRYFFRRLVQAEAADCRQATAEFLVRDWNRRNPPERQIVDFELVYFDQQIGEHGLLPDYVSFVVARVEVESPDVSHRLRDMLRTIEKEDE